MHQKRLQALAVILRTRSTHHEADFQRVVVECELEPAAFLARVSLSSVQ
jgi:primosomal replication protein N